MGKKLTDGQLANIKDMWERGMKVSQIVYLTNTSSPTVYALIKKWKNPEPVKEEIQIRYPDGQKGTLEILGDSKTQEAMANYEMPEEKTTAEDIEASRYFKEASRYFKSPDRSHGNTEYHTKDMFLIAVLLMYGFIPAYINKEQYSKYARFSFPKSDKLYLIIDSFFGNILPVQANPYIQCYRALKGVVLNEEEMVTVPLVERICSNYIGVHNIPA